MQALARSAGLAGVSAHSGRRGMATELVRRGAPTTAIQQAGGWKGPLRPSRIEKPRRGYRAAENVLEKTMERKRDGFVLSGPLGDLPLDLPGVQVPRRTDGRCPAAALLHEDPLRMGRFGPHFS